MLSDVFSQCFREDDRESLRRMLELAGQTHAHRSEAFIWQALLAFKQDQPEAVFLPLAKACEALSERSDILLLLARCLDALQQPELAARLLRRACERFPLDSALRRQYWLVSQKACTTEELRRELVQRLPHVEDAQELKLIVELLLLDEQAPRVLGVVDYDVRQQALVGWAIDLQASEAPVVLRLATDSSQGEFPADRPCALLSQAGLAHGHGGLHIRLGRPASAIHVNFRCGAALMGSPVAAVPVFEAPPPVPGDPASAPVDVLLPVYKGYDSTLACLQSALQAAKANRTRHRLVVLDDASPDTRLSEALQRLASQHGFIYIRRAANLGFIRNMNRGMALNPGSDVVWLNADTLVHGNWLDRLRAAAYTAGDIASVTPWSNNGELMSFPQSRICHPMPDVQALARLDQLAGEAGLASVEIETGCGFCLYIRREALHEVGYLDELVLRRGYGEETDWCLRARSKGWRHLGATDVFVAHAGGHSFGAEKALRVQQNNAVLRQRYPDAERRFDAFIARDPLAPARQHLQRLVDAQALAGAHKRQSGKDAAHELHLPKAGSAQLPGRCWLIADRLDSLALGERWLALARQLARQAQPIMLLLAEDGPWWPQLQATGNVVLVPEVPGLARPEVVRLCTTAAAVSLDDTARKDSSLAAYCLHMALEHDLPLFAPSSAGLEQAGSLDQLNAYLPSRAA